MEQRKYTIGGKSYIFRLSLWQSELLGPLLSELLVACPEALNSSSDVITSVQQKLQSLPGSPDQKKIMNVIEGEVVKTFQNIIKLKLRAWLQKNKYESRILATLLVPEGEKFNEGNIPALEKLFGQEIDLDNDEDARTVDEVIGHFFRRSGVYGTSTPRSSVPEMEINSIL